MTFQYSVSCIDSLHVTMASVDVSETLQITSTWGYPCSIISVVPLLGYIASCGYSLITMAYLSSVTADST